MKSWVLICRQIWTAWSGAPALNLWSQKSLSYDRMFFQIAAAKAGAALHALQNERRRIHYTLIGGGRGEAKKEEPSSSTRLQMENVLSGYEATPFIS